MNEQPISETGDSPPDDSSNTDSVDSAVESPADGPPTEQEDSNDSQEDNSSPSQPIAPDPEDASQEASDASDSQAPPDAPSSNQTLFDIAKAKSASNQRKQESSGPRLRQIVANSLERVDSLFEEPEECNVFRDAQRKGGQFKPDHRILLINGQPKTGRFTCALQLAIWLSEQFGKRSCFTFDPSQQVLDEIIENTDDFDRESVFIIRNLSEKKINLNSFGGEYIDIINQRLDSRDAYLIMTGSHLEEQMTQELSDFLHVIDLNANQPPAFIARVIRKHLKYYQMRDGSGVDERLWELIGSLIESASEDENALSSQLYNPVHVSVFFLHARRLGLNQLSEKEAKRDIFELAQRVTSNDRRLVRKWFRDLSINAKIYAMLISLFDGLDSEAIHLLYRSALDGLQEFRIEGLHDDRQDGLEQLFEDLHVVRAEEGDVLEFKPSVFGLEVYFQIESYRHLLWTVIETTVLSWIESYCDPEFWELRLRLGRAIGRLGLYDWEKLKALLGLIAEHPHGAVASVPGYALQVIVECHGPEEDPSQLKELSELLNEWIDSKNPYLMWASAACLWRFYGSLVDLHEEFVTYSNATAKNDVIQVEETLRRCEASLARLAKRFDKIDEVHIAEMLQRVEPDIEISPEDMVGQVAQCVSDIVDSIVRAVLEVYRTHPERAVRLVCNWMQDENTADREELLEDNHTRDSKADKTELEAFHLQQFGALIGARLLEKHRNSELLRESHSALLSIVRPVLHLASNQSDHEGDLADSYGPYQQAVDSLLNVLQEWLGNDKWTERVYTELLRSINRSAPHQRRRITRTLINDWLSHEKTEIQRIGCSLLARALIIDGTPTDLPGSQRGVILLEGSRFAKRHHLIRHLGEALYHRFTEHVDVALSSLGSQEFLPAGDKTALRTQLACTTNLPLALPALEQLDIQDIHFVLLIGHQYPIDLMDLEDVSPDWAKKVLIRLVSEKTGSTLVEEAFEELGVFADALKSVKSYRLEKEREQIFYAVDRAMESSLVTRSSDQWWSRLETYFSAGTNGDVEVVVKELKQLSQRFDDIPKSSSNCDAARLIGCSLQWLLKVSPESLVNLLTEWIELPEDAPQVPMGRSYARMLFRILSQHPTTGREQTVQTDETDLDPWGFPVDAGDADDGPNSLASSEEIPTFPEVNELEPLLRLAPLLAESEDWQATKSLLHWVRRWAHHPDWGRRFRYSEELVHMIESCPAFWREHLSDYLSQFWTANANWGEEEPPQEAERIGRRLQTHLLLGKSKSLPALAADQRLLVVLLEPNQPKLARIARELMKCHWKKFKRKGKSQIALFRIGQVDPISVPGDHPNSIATHLTDVPIFSPLAAPILEILPREQVDCVLLLANNAPYDLDDYASDWVAEGHFYGGSEDHAARWAPEWFRTPKVKGSPKATAQRIFEDFESRFLGELRE